MTDREKLVAVAKSYNELRQLRIKQAKTMAEMLRLCVQQIKREPSAFADRAERQAIVAARADALHHLLEMAKMLEGEAECKATGTN